MPYDSILYPKCNIFLHFALVKLYTRKIMQMCSHSITLKRKETKNLPSFAGNLKPLFLILAKIFVQLQVTVFEHAIYCPNKY